MTEPEVAPATKPKAPPAKATKSKTVKKTVTKKAAVKKDAAKSAETSKSKAPAKKVVKPKTSTIKARKPKPKVEAPAKKLAKAKTPKSAPKPKKTAPASEFTKFETLALEAITLSATDEKPYVSGTKVRQYALDYEGKAQAAQIPRYAKNALLSLLIKKIVKAKKDSYALTSKGKEVAPEKVQKRSKVVRVAKAAAKSKKAVEPVKKPVTTTSGRTSRPVGQ
jgi:hypothetical protein